MMDISVSHLNNRMALQVPVKLPLGLVFIVGQVAKLRAPGSNGDLIYFDLVDEEHRLQCRLPTRVAEETLLEEGDRIRVGGHLVFDSQLARYFLFARDLQVLPRVAPDAAPLVAKTTAVDVNKPAVQAALEKVDLPPWVLKLAPPEVQRELGLDELLEPEPDAPEQPGAPDLAVDGVADGDDTLSNLSPQMLHFLSSAIDSKEDIELTAEMIADHLPEEQPKPPREKLFAPAPAAPVEAWEANAVPPAEPTPFPRDWQASRQVALEPLMLILVAWLILIAIVVLAFLLQ